MALRLKSAAVVSLRAALTFWAQGRGPRLRPRPADPERPKVYILVMHPWSMGGTIRTVMNLAGQLSQHHDVELIGVVRRREKPFFDIPPGVELIEIDDTRETLPRGRVRRMFERYPSVLFSRVDSTSRSVTLWTDLRLARVLRERTSGVMIGTRPGLNLLVAHVASPALVKIGQEHLHLSAHKKRVRNAIRRGYPKLDALAVLTESDREAYTRFLEDAVRVEAIPNAVTKLGGGISDLSAKKVIAAGRMKRQKAFATLIRAFATVAEKHPDWSLEICGGGPRRARLEAVIAERGLERNVTLRGRVRDLGPELAAASLYALSSRREGFPMVLLEAMSKGLPVVSFDCPTGPREIVRQRENGILVPDKDVRALAAGLCELIEDEELRRRCGRGALATAERYAPEVIGARWERLLDELRGARA
jgi:glycosyltransferase involved in cell wall biosynthesis